MPSVTQDTQNPNEHRRIQFRLSKSRPSHAKMLSMQNEKRNTPNIGQATPAAVQCGFKGGRWKCNAILSAPTTLIVTLCACQDILRPCRDHSPGSRLVCGTRAFVRTGTPSHRNESLFQSAGIPATGTANVLSGARAPLSRATRPLSRRVAVIGSEPSGESSRSGPQRGVPSLASCVPRCDRPGEPGACRLPSLSQMCESGLLCVVPDMAEAFRRQGRNDRYK